MRRNFSRLFEPPFLEAGLPNPRHLSNAAYLSLARSAARRGALRNDVSPARIEIAFPGSGFAPTRVAVAVRNDAEPLLSRYVRRVRRRAWSSRPEIA